MEFKSREACIEHHVEQFPTLPRYMIELALNYDLAEQEKPPTGKQKRKLKAKVDRKKPTPIERKAVASETAAVVVMTAAEYTPAPPMKCSISVDGADAVEKSEENIIDASDIL